MQGKEIFIQIINFVAVVMREIALGEKEGHPINCSPMPFPVRNIQKNHG